MAKELRPLLVQTKPLGSVPITCELAGIEPSEVSAYMGETGKAFQLGAVSYSAEQKKLYLRFVPGNGCKKIVGDA